MNLRCRFALFGCYFDFTRVVRLLQNAISSFSTGNTYQLALAWSIRFRGQNVYLGGENFPNFQKSGKDSRVPCPNSAQSRLPISSQFPNPVKILDECESCSYVKAFCKGD